MLSHESDDYDVYLMSWNLFHTVNNQILVFYMLVEPKLEEPKP